MKENIKLDHFENLEILTKTIERWIETDEECWDRWLNLEDIFTICKYTLKLQKQIEELGWNKYE